MMVVEDTASRDTDAGSTQSSSLLPPFVRLARFVVMWIPQRGHFGEERYEKADFQRTVRSKFLALMKDDKASTVLNGPLIPETRSFSSERCLKPLFRTLILCFSVDWFSF